MLPSISETGALLSHPDSDSSTAGGNRPVMSRISDFTFTGYSFLDTLADIASQSSPLKSKVVKTSDITLRSRPRASSEPWLSSFITRQMEDCLKDSRESSARQIENDDYDDDDDENDDTIMENEAESREDEDDEPSSPATLPQMLEKYSAIYNKNGRIGIYTREERNEMISRFHEKRKRRVWKKKIRYHCRKNLADSRVRVKGRFVKCADDSARHNVSNTKNAAGDLITSVKVEKSSAGSTIDDHIGAFNDSTTTESVDFSQQSQVGDGQDIDKDEIKDSMYKSERISRKRMRRHSIAY